MRTPRLKPEGIPVFYHLYNRVCGDPEDFPFDSAEKEQFVRLLYKLDVFFCVKVVSFQVMSNHFHLIAHAPAEPPSIEEACSRYNAYYRGKRTLTPEDPRCPLIAERMRDISCYMHALQHQFSTWFNRTRPQRRRGALWASRFKHTLLGDARAVWECWKYIELNPVRAGMVQDPADYRFCSFGAWAGRGKHPFAENVRQVLLPFLQGIYPYEDIGQLYQSLSGALAEVISEPLQTEEQSTRFLLAANRRMRYWVDGLVIGSELFVQEMIRRSRGHLRKRRRAFTRAQDALGRTDLYAYRQLRTT